MNFKKRLLALILPVLMVASMSMSAFAQEAKSSTFTDVPEGSYYAEAVATVSELGLMTGMSEGVFGPTKTLSRAMVATVLYRLGGEQEPEKPGSEYFTDVAAGSFYDKPVGWCYEKGITTGYGNGTFLPARNITREEYATFMYRMVLKLYPDQVYEGCDGTPDATTAQDWSDAHDYSQKALSWAVDAGIIKGMNNSETDMIIKPRGNISRADTAVMMSRLLTYLEDTANNSAVTILYTNDVHTYIDGAMSYATIGQMKKDLETAGKNVLLVDAGDHIQGTAYGAMDEGETIRQLMAEAGYDLATLGNHEFDYGMSIALKTATENTVPYVSCNFKEDLDLDGEWENVLNSYEIFEFEDYTVGIVGITTPESISKSTPAYFMNEDGEWVYSIDTQEGQDLYEDVQAAVDAVIEEGADIVIAIGHLGDDYSASPWTSEETIENTTGIDAFIDGHSHSTVENRIVQNKDGEDVVLTQTGSYYKAIGEMFIEADGTINTRLVKSYYAEDEEIAAIEDEWMADVDTQLGKTIAETEIEFTVAGEDGSRAVRKYETNLADLDADAYYYYINEVAGLDCDLTFTNGGGVRATIPAGEWTYKTAKTVNPFGNVLCLMEVNGQQILDALEFGARMTPDVECGGFLHGSGVTYKIDADVPNTVEINSANIWTGPPSGAYRVHDVQIYNKETASYEPLDLNKTYKLGGINYTLRQQGDGFNMFNEDLGMTLIMEGISVDYMAMSTYLQAFTDTDGNGIANIASENSPLAKYENFLIDYENPKGAGRTVMEAGPASIAILYTNDVHTYIDGAMSYATIGQMKEDLSADMDVLLVDAGDHIQGTAYGAMDEGATIRQLMAAAGYDLATLGNHEFDYGMNIALKTAKENTVPYVSCNFKEDLDQDGTWENVLDSYKIFELEDYTVGIVGITTPESISKSTPAYFMNEDGEWVYSIDTQEGQDLYEDVQAAVDAVIEEGADIVIAIGHLGDDYSASPWTSEETIANTTGIDAFIDGHSHSKVEGKIIQNKDGEDVLLTQTGSYYNNIGKLTIRENGVISTELISSYESENAEIAAIEDAWMADVDTQLGQTIAETDIEFTVAGEDGKRAVRKYETNLADLDADAYYYYINEVAGLECDLTFTNGGGVRATIPAGDWTYKTAKTVNPFGNVLCLMEVTGQQILDALEFGSRLTPDVECGGFLHGSGVTYKVDTTVENTVQIDSANIWTGSPTGAYRVYDVKIYNKETAAYEPLDVNKKYKLGGINYTLRRQGDGFNMFRADLGMTLIMEGISVDYMAMSTYLQAFTDTDGNGIANIATANSPLNKYANFLIDYENPKGAGRTVITTGEPEEPEVWDQKVIIGGTELNVWFTKYGNTYCDCTVEHFMGTDDNGFGFEYGDLVEIGLNGQKIVAPVVSNYSDVDSGTPCIRIADGASYVEMAINMGNFGQTYGLVTITKVDGNYSVSAQDGVTFPVDVTFTLKEKGGYLAEMLLHQLNRTNNRTDYPTLSDAEFANVRKINTNGMGDYLYRGSSPINPEIGRNTYADAEIQEREVSVIMNLADNDTTAAGYEGFAESYYSKQKVIYLNLGVDVTSAEFKAGFANGLKFFAENEGTYYVHCTEGKDRAGFASAFLECFMGATADEVIADYMVTYYNYYGVEPGTDKYNAIANSNIVKTLQNVFGVADIKTADLAAEAAEYMKEAGLTDTEIANLRANLARRMVG